MSQSFLEASLRRDHQAAVSSIGLQVPQEWFADQKLMALRSSQCRENPAYRPFSLRAVALLEGAEMIGHIGFHTTPGAPYLASYAPGGVELGYVIFEGHRRIGYATEALLGMLRWAWQVHKVPRFVLSISPNNTASSALAEKLGWVKVGEQMDEEDGLEWIWMLEGDRLRRLMNPSSNTLPSRLKALRDRCP